jgi:DNA-binding NtrC family response regulator/tetratricopeptide (TPR) repeat protein
MPSPRVRKVPMSPDIARLLGRVERTREFLRSGRHAAAERLLREVAGSLHRRDAGEAEARVLIELGSLLLERGRAGHADRVCRDAAEAATRARDEALAIEARIGQALARVEARQLSGAEALCRALIVAGTLSAVQRAIVHAALARVLMLQSRYDEAAELELEVPEDASPDPRTALVDDTAVSLLLERGNVFAAGQRARAALARGRESDLGHAIALRAHLRVMAATGDCELMHGAFAAAVAAARRARSPLDVLRAHLVWADALSRASRTRDLACVCRVLKRMRPAAPPLLRGAIDARIGDATDRRTPSIPLPPGDAARTLVQVCHERDDDRDAVSTALGWMAARLHTGRVDLWSCDAGPASVLITVGTGPVTTLGERVLEAGIAVGPSHPCGGEIGVPVRLGSTLLAALVARWPADRPIPPHAASLLEVTAAVAAPRIERIQSASREQAHAATSVPELVGVSDAIAVVRKAVSRAAAAPFAILIEGESGSGKELVARAIHQLSPRRERRFCDLNCAALPDDLLDAELFGHARGAFTGAVADRAGLFEEADGGTLFLDELADLSPRAQAKLLRAIQEQEVRRVGESFDRKIDVRIVTAANRDMREEAAAGRFRQDLLYRLDVIRIRIPPLRERPADIGVLAAHFWAQAAARVGTTATLTHGVLAALSAYAWPGNVRELQNVMSALAVAAPARGRVQPSLLPAALAGAAAGGAATTLAMARAQFERRFIEAALARAGGRRAAAARALGLSRQGLLKLMARLGVTEVNAHPTQHE